MPCIKGGIDERVDVEVGGEVGFEGVEDGVDGGLEGDVFVEAENEIFGDDFDEGVDGDVCTGFEGDVERAEDLEERVDEGADRHCCFLRSFEMTATCFLLCPM